jgi:uncharacterized protein (DUF1778 family)
MKGIRNNLLALQREILNLPPAPETMPPSAETVSPPSAAEVNPGGQTAPVDAAAALRTRRCPVCDQLYSVAFDFLSQWQYAVSTDEKAQTQFAAELGFCPLHTWQLDMLSSPVGASAGFAKLVERVSRLLTRASESADAAQAVRDLARDTKNCRVCRMLREAEKTHTETLAGSLAEAAGREAYARSQGACLRHLAMMIAASDNKEVAQFLLSEAARRFEEVAEDMQAFALKTDALRRHLRNKDEEDAYLRAITHLVGNRSVCVPWPNDAELE